MSDSQPLEFSASVQIWLEADELCLSVAQVGDRSLILAEAAADSHFSLPLVAYLVTFVEEHRTEFQIVPRWRRGREIFFEGCHHEAPERDPDLDSVPF